MATITVRNLPDEIHRALRIRAATNGLSTEAEVRLILEQAVRPETRLKLGSTLQRIGQELALEPENLAIFERQHQDAASRADFE